MIPLIRNFFNTVQRIFIKASPFANNFTREYTVYTSKQHLDVKIKKYYGIKRINFRITIDFSPKKMYNILCILMSKCININSHD